MSLRPRPFQSLRSLTTLALTLLLAAPALAQRPDIYTVTPPPQFQRAVENGTRTLTGEPGPNYWQNRVDYDLSARIDTETDELIGSGAYVYTNNSPDSLAYMVFKLRQNLHKEGVMRNRPVYMTGGLTVRNVTVGEQPITETDGSPEPGEYVIDGTVMTIALHEPITPGTHVEMSMDWRFAIPPGGPLAVRMGQDGEVYYLGYWYPQPAVYDDVYGWHTAPYLGNGEHYMNIGSYDIEIDAPAGWLLWATGTLQNESEVLNARTQQRLEAARASSEIVSVVGEGEIGDALQPGDDGRLVWRFHAEQVRDVAFSLSNTQIWDATGVQVDRDGDGTAEPVLINVFYRPGTAAWDRAAEFSAFSVEHLSETLFPYPYPHMTAVEGVIGGGMEYPMMTVIGGDRDDISLFGVTYHEIAHMWYPMIVGTNEKSFTWMDEGFTSYNDNQGQMAFWNGSAADRPEHDAWARPRQSHYAFAGTGFAVPPMRHNDRYPVAGSSVPAVDPDRGAARVVASYSTPAVLLRAMEGIFGTETFYDAYNDFGKRWAFKHPYPYDFFHTVETSLNRDLDWLWTPTLFETWTVDPAIADVRLGSDSIHVVIENRGLAPMPVPVTVTYLGGASQERVVPVDAWLDGATEATLTFPRGGIVSVVQIDPEGYLHDADVTNNEVAVSDDGMGHTKPPPQSDM